MTIKTKVGKFNLVLENDKFRIYNDYGSWTFKINYFYPNNELHLDEYVEYQGSRILVERFSSHEMEIEVHFINTGKTYYLGIPIEKPYFLGIIDLIELRENGDLNSIINYYRTMFLDRQSNYDKSNNTVIRVFQKTDNYLDYNNKGIKLDELFLKNGHVTHYELGSLYFDKYNNLITVSLRDGTYTIAGYQSATSFLDLNESINLLERRKRELK